ncbi:MAG: peptidoglycan DD-metalloendopeptidase family protein [Bacteroidia bacterium]|nr:peptidoglycan DD-metalloendopeptidase family protein [Bacteroidia bacterium]
MYRYCIYILILLFSVTGFNTLYGQSKKELEQKKKKNQKEIDYTNKLLKENKKSKNKSYNTLLILNRKISLRKELIAGISSEIKNLNIKIDKNNKEINSLAKELVQLKKDYAQLIYYAYKNRSSYDRLMYILSANDFNQAYKRLKYLQQYSEYRRKQATAIVKNQKILAKKLAELQVKINEKQDLLAVQQEETTQLTKEKEEQTEILSSLKSKETELKEKLEEHILISRKLQKTIENLIASEEEARRKANEIARKEKKEKEKKLKEEKIKALKNKNLSKKEKEILEKEEKELSEEKEDVKSTNKPDVFEMTPEEKITSANFGNNKGFLPWPTERGLITGTFGEHEHPVLPGIIIRNDGIDISTSEGENVRAIFSGVVSKVMQIPGFNNVIIIRHGNYLSVYSNLSQVNVKTGDKVTAKQKIGKVFTDTDDDNKTILHLQIWKNNIKMDPALWLSQRNSN